MSPSHSFRTIVALLVVALTCCASAVKSVANEAARADDKVPVLLVTGFDVNSHKWEESAKLNQAILEESGRFEVTISRDKNVFASDSLSDYAVIILNYGFWNEPDPDNDAKQGLLKYVEEGGNVVALHFACSSFQEWTDYADLLGRVWKKGVGGHGPYGEFTVNVADGNHPVMKGLDDFKIEDELYAKLTGDADIEVLASAYSEWSSKVEPIVFAKNFGKGRVLQNLLGHGLDSKADENYQRLLCRCVEWAATGAVTVE